MSNIVDARRALVARILDGDGKALAALRRAAFDNEGLDAPLAALVDKVSKHAHRVVDEDFARAIASGLEEDQLFEIVVCAAVGQSTRQHDAALEALAAAARGA